MLLDQLAPLCQRLAHHVLSLQYQQVEDEEVQRRAGRAIVLQRVEGRPAVRIERHDLAVDDRFIRHRRQRLHDAGIAER